MPDVFAQTPVNWKSLERYDRVRILSANIAGRSVLANRPVRNFIAYFVLRRFLPCAAYLNLAYKIKDSDAVLYWYLIEIK
jgi:hypothetical protein